MSERGPSAFSNEEPRPDGKRDLHKPYLNCTTEIDLFELFACTNIKHF